MRRIALSLTLLLVAAIAAVTSLAADASKPDIIVVMVDDLGAKSYPMPSTCDGRDEVFVGRIREDLSSPNGIAFWCVSDNLRKGAATNAVQIAELLVREGWGMPQGAAG